MQEGKLHYYANDHIKEYMHNELKFISDFKKNPKKKYHYSFSIRFRDINGYDDCNDYNDLINNFDSFDACINEVKYKAKNKPNEVLVVYESKQFGYDFLISNGKWVEYFSSDYKSWVYLEYYDGIPKMSEEEIESLKRKSRRVATRLEKEYEELN